MSTENKELADVFSLVKIGLKFRSVGRANVCIDAVCASLARLASQNLSLRHCGYAIHGLALVFACYCRQFNEKLDILWKKMIGLSADARPPSVTLVGETTMLPDSSPVPAEEFATMIPENEVPKTDLDLSQLPNLGLNLSSSPHEQVGPTSPNITANEAFLGSFHSLSSSIEDDENDFNAAGISPIISVGPAFRDFDIESSLGSALSEIEFNTLFQDGLDRESEPSEPHGHASRLLNLAGLDSQGSDMPGSEQQGGPTTPVLDEVFRGFQSQEIHVPEVVNAGQWISESQSELSEDRLPDSETGLPAGLLTHGPKSEPRGETRGRPTSFPAESASHATVTTDLVLFQKLPITKPGPVPKSLLNIPEDSGSDEEITIESIVSVSPPRKKRLHDSEYDAKYAIEIQDLDSSDSDQQDSRAYSQRNQLKSRFDIDVRIPRACPDLAAFARMLSAHSNLARKRGSHVSQEVINLESLRIPSLNDISILDSFKAIPETAKHPPASPEDVWTAGPAGTASPVQMRDSSSEPPQPEMQEFVGTKELDRVQPSNHLETDPFSEPVYATVDDIMRGGSESLLNDSMSVDFSVDRPHAAGYAIEAPKKFLELMSEDLSILEDNDEGNSSRGRMSQERANQERASQEHVSLEQRIVDSIQQTGTECMTLHQCYSSLIKNNELADFQMGDFVYELTFIAGTRIEVYQNVSDEALQPVYIRIIDWKHI